jgi:hypothetical protein
VGCVTRTKGRALQMAGDAGRTFVESAPAFQDFTRRPPGGALGRVAKHEVMVVVHQRAGAEVDGEDLGEEGEALDDQLSAVVEGLAGDGIQAAEEGATDAAADAVVVGGVADGHEGRAGSSHP